MVAGIGRCPKDGKIQYFSKRDALAQADANAERERTDRYFYACGVCGFWHLTHNPPRVRGRWWGNYRFRTKAS